MSCELPKSASQLAKQVIELIRDARFDVGHHLREQHLADVLGTSRSPIRSALTLLESLGAVESRRNHGFFLKLSPDELGRVELNVPATNDQALYDRVVRERLAGVLPESMTQTDIAKRYLVDRVTMMKTLSRLAEDGLIVRNRGHGWTFQPSLETTSSLKGSYDFRLALEPSSLLLSTFNVDRVALDKCRREHFYLLGHPDLGSVSPAQLFDTDANFHEMLARFSGNVFYLQAIQQQNRLRRLLEFGGYSNKRRIREWCAEHMEILDALEADDRTKAAELLRSHLVHAYGAAGAATPKSKREKTASDIGENFGRAAANALPRTPSRLG
jgi:DNA-binding GntR family transcriptional regulator